MALGDLLKEITVVVLSFGVVIARVGYYIVTPLWLDYFKPTCNFTNITNHSCTENTSNATIYGGINSTFLLVGQWAFVAVFSGVILLLMKITCPQTLTEVNFKYPKYKLFLVGLAQALSSIAFNYGLSGSRTPPYLQAILGNFNIPIQFAIRFLLLRKKPTFTKACCAGAVLMAEFVCLIPTIFPSLESSADRKEEGGATGAGAVLWPICIVASQIPYAVANTLMEKSVQDKKAVGQSTHTINPGDQEDSEQEEDHTVQEEQLNIIYFTFWWSLFISLTCGALFWVDLIPGFGTASSITELGHMIGFSAGCMVGVSEGCGGEVIALGWLNFSFALLGALTFSTLMRYSEGSNYVIIVLAFRTPLVFIFWTLFEESPFQWNPHLALSTYLSVFAILVMIPAIVIYNTGLTVPSWCSWLPCKRKSDEPEMRSLLDDDALYHHGNDDSLFS